MFTGTGGPTDVPFVVLGSVAVGMSLIPTVTSHGHQYGLTITEAVLIQICLS
jgi:hypothetical protein